MKKWIALIVFLNPFFLHAEEAPLDHAYSKLKHPRKEWVVPGRALPVRSDALSVYEIQSEVKAQGQRGTCSIFSATALFEAMLIKNRLAQRDIDLSEEWLQYLIAQYNTDYGSTSPANFSALREWGQPLESDLPYIGEEWESSSSGLAKERCGGLKNSILKRCLVGHRNPDLLNKRDEEMLKVGGKFYDPEFVQARKSALDFAKYLSGSNDDYEIIGSISEIKRLLASGTPITLDLDFFYGAWNHRLANELGIGRDMDLWSKGIVTYPEQGSLDEEKSHTKPAGHSFVLIGYDDEKEVEYTIKMKNGEMKTFKRKGVYYFKNSWGTDGFGADFTLEGTRLPGYGMITQDYAHESGQFFQLKL